MTRGGLGRGGQPAVTGDDGRSVTLLIGKSAGERVTHVMRPPPPDFPGRPMEVEEPVEFLYARLKDNDQVFEIKADRLKDVFTTATALRDPRPAHFQPDDATRLEIRQGGQEIVLVRGKDKDRWKLEKPLHADADRQKITDLLNRLSNLEARDPDVINGGRPWNVVGAVLMQDCPVGCAACSGAVLNGPQTYGVEQPTAVVTVTVEEKAAAGQAGDEDVKKTRVATFRLGNHDDATKKVYVQVDDWPRINAVADGGSPGDAGLSALVKREPREYRGKRLFDFAATDDKTDLKTVTVQRGNDPPFVLQKDDKGWRLTAGTTAADADALAASTLANALSGLEVLEYVPDAPKPEELESKYGLGKPELTVRLEFTDKTKPAQVLQVGKKREDKPGRFARLADDPAAPPTSIFAVSEGAIAALDEDALAYLPKRLWNTPAGAATAVRIHRAGQPEYSLTKAGAGWKIAGPFDADAAITAAQPLADALAAPVADGAKAFDAPKPADFGLDQPYLTAALTTADGKEHTLTVGGPTAMGAKTRYARADKNPAVFAIGEAAIASLDKPALTLLDPVLFRLGDEQIDHVRIRTKVGDKEEALKLALQGNDWQVVEGPGAPFPADKAAAARMQFLWSGLHAVGFKDYGPQVKWEDYGLATPSGAITVGVRKDKDAPVVEHTIALGNAADNGGRYARFDDRPGVAILDANTVRELSRSHLGFVDPTVFDFDAGAAAALTLHPKQGADVELAKQADGWKLTKPTEENADEKTLQDLLARLSHLRAVSVADYPAGNLEPFGLAAPEVAATVKLGADAKHTLLIGKEADAATGDRYAMAEGGKAVVVVPAVLARRLTAGPLAFRDRQLLRIASTPDRVRLERDPRKAVFANVDGAWKMTEPTAAALDQDALQEFLDDLLALRAGRSSSRRSRRRDQLKTYGLDNPEAKWILKNGDKDLLTLLVGKAEKAGGRVYAKLSDRDWVFLLSPALTARALGEYRTPRTVWAEPPDAVQAVALTYKGSPGGFELDKGDDGWKAAEQAGREGRCPHGGGDAGGAGRAEAGALRRGQGREFRAVRPGGAGADGGGRHADGQALHAAGGPAGRRVEAALRARPGGGADGRVRDRRGGRGEDRARPGGVRETASGAHADDAVTLTITSRDLTSRDREGAVWTKTAPLTVAARKRSTRS